MFKSFIVSKSTDTKIIKQAGKICRTPPNLIINRWVIEWMKNYNKLTLIWKRTNLKIIKTNQFKFQ